jgi:hypothetical protein
MMREFRQQHGRTGERYWKVWFEAPPGETPEVVHSAWGAIKNGKHKEHGNTNDRPGPKGKEGTKAYVSAAENACFHMDRMIRKKMEEGYVEVGLDGRAMVGGPITQADTIDFSKPLPKNLCFSKPKNNVSESAIRKVEERLVYTRKLNGMMIIAYTDAAGNISLYSRRLDDLTEHFPHLVKAMLDLQIPPQSIMLFEAFMGDGNTHEELLEVQAIMRSKAARAQELQKNRGWMKFYLFRLPFYCGEFVESRPAGQIIEMIENTFTDLFYGYEDKKYKTELYAIQPFEGSYDEALVIAEEEGYEGWVAYIADEALGDYSYSFHGKPDRPKSCFKVKIDMEDDFIAYWDPENGSKEKPLGTWGTGKNKGRIGTLSLYQHGPHGKKYYICEVGSGLTDEDREKLADPGFYPLVVAVKFQSRRFISKGADSNALFLPRVAKIHEDKGSMECWSDDLIDPDA